MNGSSRSRYRRAGAFVELDPSVVSEALRLRLDGTGDGAVAEDEAADIESGLGRERDRKGGDIDVSP
jgi:hypothetical protein